MKKLLYLIPLSLLGFEAFSQAPANDNCSGATSLGTLPTPLPCPSGTGSAITTTGTTINATGPNPYTSLLGCQTGGNQSNPAIDVWYSFTATGNAVVLNITPGAAPFLATPNVAMWSGSCGALVGFGCAVGNASGNLTVTFQPTAPGTTYYFQISGNTPTSVGNFNMSLQNNNDCSNCLQTAALTVTPNPVNGTYTPGQVVNFCFRISSYTQVSSNWLHGVIPTFGCGWNMASFTPGAPAAISANGTWNWYPGGCTSSATGVHYGPGFYFDYTPHDNNPGNNFGDYNPSNLAWNFCFSIAVGNNCACTNLNVSIKTTSDGISGSWSSIACVNDPVFPFSAQISCCVPPTMTNTNPLCFGGTGTATATPVGAVSPWSYTWTNSVGTTISTQNNLNGPSTVAGLAAGTYTVSVKDNVGCVSSATVTITQPPVLAVTIGPPTNVNCNGGTNGSATATATGGTGAYAYSWSPSGGTAATGTGLGAGTYTVTVTDANGCTKTATVAITQPPPLTATNTHTNVSCNGGANGTATVTAAGGTPAYAYAWTPSGGTAATANGLAAGTYTCTITDAKGCVTTSVVTITQPTLLVLTTTNTSATCGNPNGTATVTAAGGTVAYTYSWSPSGGTTATATGLLAGTYTITVTDANGCVKTSTTTVNNSGGPSVTIAPPTNVSCNGGTNGSATATGTGGTAPYTYSWTPSGGTLATATGLAAGTYTCTLRDANGCVTSATVTITQPAAMVVTIAPPTNVSCNGGTNGSATATATNGTAPYGYVWSPSGGTAATATGLAAGTYTVTVTDANGCSKTATTTITQPTALSATNTQTNVSCNGGADGTATVTAAGGTPAYAYVWAPSGGTTANATGLAAGTYTCTITDSKGCTTTSTATITQPALLVLTTSTTTSTCGNPNGSATVTATGGTGAYAYSWSPSGGTAATATGLLAGTYSVTVTDAKGCVKTATATVTNAGGPVATISGTTNVSCNGGTNGSATVSVTGGAPAYTYSWTPSGGTLPTATGLSAGTYTITVKDANGCTTTATATITEPAAMVVTIAPPTNVSCNGGANGSATATATNGTPPYAYTWTPSGGTGATGTGLAAGTYTVTVTDANGCTKTATTTITQPTALGATNTQTNVSCNGGADGTATVTPTGGTPAYAYVWAPSGGTGATATGLAAGTYTCTITDSKGCTTTSTVTITQPTLIVLTTSMTSSSCGNPNGTATVSIAGGTPAYNITWSPSGGTGLTASGLMAGTYTVTVTDSKGCTQTANVTVTNAGGPTATMGTITQVTCNGACDGTATAIVTGGAAPLTYTWAPSGGSGVTATGLCPGTYTFTVRDANGCTATATATITQPAILVATMGTPTQVTCNGACNGSASVTASGGTPGYTYSWSPSGGTGSTASNLCAGTYTVTVTDANGCTKTASVTITQPPLLSVSAAGINATCNGQCSGQIICIPAGGTTPYTYSWSTGCTAPSCNNICAGTYTVTVTDAKGCTVTATATVGQPTPLVLTTSSTTAHCNQSDGSATVTVTGATPAYTYVWRPSPPVSTVSTDANIGPGTYTVTVTDANGCKDSSRVVVANAPGVVAAIPASTQPSCFGGNNGTATATATGGTGAPTYTWIPNPPGGQGTPNATGLSAGTYTCVVRDAVGCRDTARVTISQPAQVVVTPMATVTICNGSCTPLTATTTGGTGAYTYSWTNGATPVTSPVCPTTNTTYTVVATDANGCASAPRTVLVKVNPPLEVTATPLTSAVCPGFSSQLTAVGSGGNNGPYTYSWTPAAGLSNANIANPVATPAVTTTYTVIVSDNCGTPTDSATVVVTVYPTPVPVITADKVTGCNPLCVTFTATSLPACSSASWTFGDGGLGTGCGNQVHCYTTAGSYSVSITLKDINGCVGTLTKPNFITVYPLPEAAFTANPQSTTILSPQVTFTDQSTGATSWNWSFGDLSGASSTLQNPHYAYPDTGCFTVTLLVKSGFGCLDTANSVVCILPDFTFFAPNAFTPNGDGINDIWTPKGEGIDPNSYTLYMFDRWGNLVFYTSTWGKGWDGRANNGSDVAQQDTYVWKVDLKDFKGNKHSYTGMCNLIK